MTKHFIIQLANRPGELAHLARALAARGVNIVHIAGGGKGEHAFACLETDDFQATHEVVSGLGCSFVEGESIVVEVPDQPGSVAAIAEKLAAAGINIHSVMTVSRWGDRVEVALVVDDSARARQALKSETVLAA